MPKSVGVEMKNGDHGKSRTYARQIRSLSPEFPRAMADDSKTFTAQNLSGGSAPVGVVRARASAGRRYKRA